MQLGAADIAIFKITSRGQANDTAQAEPLKDIDLLFITGKEQLRLTTILRRDLAA